MSLEGKTKPYSLQWEMIFLKTSSCCAIIVNIFRAKLRIYAVPTAQMHQNTFILGLILTFQHQSLGNSNKKA
jgi:hypothetical protein